MYLICMYSLSLSINLDIASLSCQKVFASDFSSAGNLRFIGPQDTCVEKIKIAIKGFSRAYSSKADSYFIIKINFYLYVDC